MPHPDQPRRTRTLSLGMRAGVIALLAGAVMAVIGRDEAASEVAPKPVAPFATPARIGDGWTTQDLHAAGLDAARLRQVLAGMLAGEGNVHGVVIERHGALVAEVYRRGRDQTVNHLFAHQVEFGPRVRHDARSIGKSVIGLLLGIAIQQRRIASVQTPVLDFYPDYADLATPQRRAITLQHLLTMSSGLAWREQGSGANDEHRMMWRWSPARYVLARPIAAPPGRAFNYNSGGSALLADILTRTTGTAWDAYARRELFEPLGIRDVEWVGDFYGRPMAYTGLRMRPRDLAKLGRLLLNHGQWQGRQIVPAQWVAASSQPGLRTGYDDTRYGYQWWTGTLQAHGGRLAWAAAFGNGGQRLYVVPALDMTVVITTGAYDDPAAARRVDRWFSDIVATVREDAPARTAHAVAVAHPRALVINSSQGATASASTNVANP